MLLSTRETGRYVKFGMRFIEIFHVYALWDHGLEYSDSRDTVRLNIFMRVFFLEFFFLLFRLV